MSRTETPANGTEPTPPAATVEPLRLPAYDLACRKFLDNAYRGFVNASLDFLTAFSR